MDSLTLPLLLLIGGLILLIAEAFVPSGGMIGLLALGLLAVSLYVAFRQSNDLGIRFLVAELLLIPVALIVALQIWPRTPFARRIVLSPPTAEEVTVTHARARLDHLLGEFGRALTPLRPSGLVDFDGRRLDALSEDGLIDAGSLIRAVRIQSGQLIVRAAGDSAPHDPAPFSIEPETSSDVG
ncbi:MAG: NfeD family protein [Isosphaeraceae bacterium]|nr:NfeD family protein [Isosphaeraceae bacterium]